VTAPELDLVRKISPPKDACAKERLPLAAVRMGFEMRVHGRFFVGDPFLDGLPGRLDGLHCLDVERWRRRAGKVDDPLPKTVEAEEEFDFPVADEGAYGFHGSLAGEGEGSFVSAVRAMEAEEARGEVAAAEEGLDGGDGAGTERPEGLAVAAFVGGEEIPPAVVDDLPQGRGTGTPWLVDGGHGKMFIRTSFRAESRVAGGLSYSESKCHRQANVTD